MRNIFIKDHQYFCHAVKQNHQRLAASFFWKWIEEKWNGNKLWIGYYYYLTNLFVAMTLQKMFHVMRIGIEYASAIAFMPSNSCCQTYDATATILAKVWRCITTTATYTAIVIVFVAVVATVTAANGAVVDWHSNNSAIT